MTHLGSVSDTGPSGEGGPGVRPRDEGAKSMDPCPTCGVRMGEFDEVMREWRCLNGHRVPGRPPQKIVAEDARRAAARRAQEGVRR